MRDDSYGKAEGQDVVIETVSLVNYCSSGTTKLTVNDGVHVPNGLMMVE